jgi:hypothetical protein
MADQISWHVVLTIKQGQFDNFQMLTRETVDFTDRIGNSKLSAFCQRR